ncbi:MAG: hypothetical protein QM497_00500 [Sulfurimonas sp.]
MIDNESIKQEIKQEVQKYENDKTSSKDYFSSMQEISEWLSELEK